MRWPGRSGGADDAHSPVPTVNLLSPWSFEKLATRRLRSQFLLAGGLLLLLMAVVWGAQQLRVAQARDVLANEEAEGASLTAETQALAPVRTFVNAVDQQRRTVSQTMADEVLFSRVVRGLRSASPPGADLESVTVSLSPTGTDVAPGATGATGISTESPCPGPDPFKTRDVVGCVTLSGTAGSRATVGDFVVALGRLDLFVEPFISTTTTSDGETVAFSGSVGLAPQVFSKRYVELDELGRRGDAR